MATKITTPIALPDNGSIYPTNYFEKETVGKPNIANHFTAGSWRGKAYLESKYLADCFISCKNNLHNTSLPNNKNNDFFFLIISFILTIILSIITKIINSYEKIHSIKLYFE